MRVHHNTAKKAAKFGIELQVIENEIAAYHGSHLLATGAFGNEVLDRAITKLNGNGQANGHDDWEAAAKKPAKTRKAKTEAKTEKPARGKPAKLRPTRVKADEIEDNDDGDPGDEDIDESGSVVKSKYRERYGSEGNCGDELASKLRGYLEAIDEDGKPIIDREKLQKLGEANEIWNEKWASLNPGLARMSCGNRLRKLARAGTKIVWPR